MNEPLKQDNWEEALNKWLNTQFNDFYIIYSKAFKEDDNDGFRIVEHHAPIINKAFIRLIHNLVPWTKTCPTPYSVTEERFTLFADGIQYTIEPFDDLIHHTEYVKEV